MHDNDLDDLLTPKATTTGSDTAFDASFRVLRNRARLRMAGRTLGAGTLLALGVAVGWVMKPTPVPSVVPSVVSEAPPEPERVYAAATPDQLEQRAELADDVADVAKFYKLAGDAYLTKQQYDEAARCYRLHVKTCRETNLGKDDSWLLCSIKTSTLKEGLR